VSWIICLGSLRRRADSFYHSLPRSLSFAAARLRRSQFTRVLHDSSHPNHARSVLSCGRQRGSKIRKTEKRPMSGKRSSILRKESHQAPLPLQQRMFFFVKWRQDASLAETLITSHFYVPFSCSHMHVKNKLDACIHRSHKYIYDKLTKRLQGFPHIDFTWAGRPGIWTAAQVYFATHLVFLFFYYIFYLSATTTPSVID